MRWLETSAVKAAVTLRVRIIVTWQVPVPVQSPDHPANALGPAAVGFNVTSVPAANDAVQVPLALPPLMVQLIPPGLDVTVPLPVPPPITVNWEGGVKAAVTDCARFIVTWQVPVPVQAPDHPANVLPPLAAVGVNVTSVPALNDAAQVPLALPPLMVQLIPPGLDVTVPLPVPPPVTVNTESGVKVAVTEWAKFIVTWQVPVPVQLPDQPANALPPAGVAVRVTTEPLV
ncbi:MAG TPA: hypothetical protein VFJ16_03685 [Longimicrobium sp.]|nr:hypothetical protein [Longimicrobium sp.]